MAYVSLWLAMLAGLMISSRGLDGVLNRKVVLELHQQWTLSAMVATLAHVAFVVTDAYVDVSWRGAVIPGTSEYLPGPIALGTIALWGVGLLALSSWLQRRIDYTLWRVLHASAFGTFLLAIAHGVVAGTDSASLGAAVYATTAALLACTLMFRVLYFPGKPRGGTVGAKSTESPAPGVWRRDNSSARGPSRGCRRPAGPRRAPRRLGCSAGSRPDGAVVGDRLAPR